MSEIDARVARVLDTRRIALTVGAEKGVALDDKVTIWRTVEVKDPQTDEVLGNVRLDKLELFISEVHERFSVASVRPANLAGKFFLAPSKKISNGGSEDSVSVSENDEVTVYTANVP